MNFLIR